MKTTFLAVLLMLFVFSVQPIMGQFAIWTNPITGTNPNTFNPYTDGQEVASNITVSGIGRGAGITGTTANDRYNANSWNTVALDPTAYFYFTLTANVGETLNLYSFIYTGQKSTTGPSSFAFRSSLDNFVADIGAPTATGTTINLDFPEYKNLSTITFRFYGWNTTNSGGTFSINDFSFNDDFPLPVTISSFSNDLVKNTVGLFWTTSTEINNAGFDIERKVQDKTWIKVAFVPGAGNSTTPQSYSYHDNNLEVGSYLYRLKQIDYNGHGQYFDLNQTVNVAAPKDYSLHQNFPNPCNPETTFEYQLPELSRVRLEIFDIIGRTVVVLIDKEQEPGYHKAHFKADKLASGVYFYKLSAGAFTQIKKMIVLK